MLHFLKYLYSISPLIIQNLGISLYGLYWKKRRYGGIFEEEIKYFQARETYSKEQWNEYQTNKLRTLLLHSFQYVPYYRESFQSKGLTEEDLQTFTLKDISKLSYLEKEDLRKYGATTLLSTSRDKGQFYASSGSTGTPTQIYFSKKFHQIWSALYETRVRNWAGVHHKMRRGMIGGRRVVPNAQSSPPYYRYNYFEKQVYFSAYHLSASTVSDYVEGIKKYRLDYLVGYATSLYFLADFINQQNLKVPALKAVLTSSEKLTNTMRQTMEKAFQCKVYDGYSGVEACGIITENQWGELLFSPDSGILEVLDENGNPVENGQTGEVVMTGFHNLDQPLIRYKIGDTVTLAKNQNSKSGLQMPLIECIDGRIEDVVIGKDGRKMVRFHGLFIEIEGLKMAQIIQYDWDVLEIKLVTDSQYNTSAEKSITNRLQSQLGAIKVNFTYVSELPHTTNGKIKAVISYVK